MQIEDDKKELVYYKEVNTGRLMYELYEAIPTLKPIILNNWEYQINLRIFINRNKLMLWIPKEIQEELVNQIVENHKFIIEKEGGE